MYVSLAQRAARLVADSKRLMCTSILQVMMPQRLISGNAKKFTYVEDTWMPLMVLSASLPSQRVHGTYPERSVMPSHVCLSSLGMAWLAHLSVTMDL